MTGMREVVVAGVGMTHFGKFLDGGAVATTSAGIAFSLGYPEGQKISREEMLAAVARISRSVRVPVTEVTDHSVR